MFAEIQTNHGTFKIKFLKDRAPKTVENFVGLANGTKEWTDPKTRTQVKKPYYDGLIFHRIIEGFVIQGGDPTGTGMGGPGYKFEDELPPGTKYDKKGIVAMANAGPNTNGSQFFVTLAALPTLPPAYTVFAEVVEGQEVVDKIGQVDTDRNDRPLEPVVMHKVMILEN